MNSSIKKFYEIFNTAKILFNSKLISISKDNSSIALQHLAFDYIKEVNSTADAYDATKVPIVDAYKINFQNQLLYNYTRERTVEHNIVYSGTKIIITDSIIPVIDNDKNIKFVYIASESFDISLNDNDEVCFQFLEDSGRVVLNLQVSEHTEHNFFCMAYCGGNLISYIREVFQNNFDYLYYGCGNLSEMNGYIVRTENISGLLEENVFDDIMSTDPMIYSDIAEFLNKTYVYLVDLVKVYENVAIEFSSYNLNRDLLDEPLIMLDLDIEYNSGELYIVKFNLLNKEFDVTDDLFKVIDVENSWDWDAVKDLDDICDLSVYNLMGEIEPFQISDFTEINNNNNLSLIEPTVFTSDIEIADSIDINMSGEFVNVYKTMNKNRLNDNLNYDEVQSGYTKSKFKEFDFVLKFTDNENGKLSKIVNISYDGTRMILSFGMGDTFITPIKYEDVIYYNTILYNSKFYRGDVNINGDTISIKLASGTNISLQGLSVGDEICIANAVGDDDIGLAFFNSILFESTNNWEHLLGNREGSTDVDLLNSLEILKDSNGDKTDFAILSQLRRYIDYFKTKNGKCEFAVILNDRVNKMGVGGFSIQSFKYDDVSAGAVAPYLVRDDNNSLDSLEFIKCKLSSTTYNVYTKHNTMYLEERDIHDIEFRNISNLDFNLKVKDAIINTSNSDEIKLKPYSRIDSHKADSFQTLINSNNSRRSHLDMMLYRLESVNIFDATAKGVDLTVDTSNIGLFNETGDYKLLLNKMVFYNNSLINIDSELNVHTNIDMGHKIGLREYINTDSLAKFATDVNIVSKNDKRIDLKTSFSGVSTNVETFLSMFNDLLSDKEFVFSLEKQSLKVMRFNKDEDLELFSPSHKLSFNVLFTYNDIKHHITDTDLFFPNASFSSTTFDVTTHSNIIKFHRLENTFVGFKEIYAYISDYDAFGKDVLDTGNLSEDVLGSMTLDNHASSIDHSVSAFTLISIAKNVGSSYVKTSAITQSDKYDSHVYFKDFKEIESNKTNIVNSNILVENLICVDGTVNDVTGGVNLFTNMNSNIKTPYRTSTVYNSNKTFIDYNNDLRTGSVNSNIEYYLFNVVDGGMTKSYRSNSEDVDFGSLALFKNECVDIESYNIYESLVNGISAGDRFWSMVNFENSKSFDMINEIHTEGSFNYMVKRRFVKNQMKKSNYMGVLKSMIGKDGLTSLYNLSTKGYTSYEYGAATNDSLDDYENKKIKFEDVINVNPRIRRLYGDHDITVSMDDSDANRTLIERNRLTSKNLNDVMSVAFDMKDTGDYYREMVIPCYLDSYSSNIVKWVLDISKDISYTKNDIMSDSNYIKFIELVINDNITIPCTMTVSATDDLVTISVDQTGLSADEVSKLTYVKGVRILAKHDKSATSYDKNIIEIPIKGFTIEKGDVTVDLLYRIYDANDSMNIISSVNDAWLVTLKSHSLTGDHFTDSDGVKFSDDDSVVICKRVLTASRKSIPIMLINPIEIYHPTGFKKFIENDDIKIKANNILSLEIKKDDYDLLKSLDEDSFSSLLMGFGDGIYKYVGSNSNCISASIDNMSTVIDGIMKRSDYLKDSKFSDVVFSETRADKTDKYFLCIPNYYDYKLIDDLFAESASAAYGIFKMSIYKFNEIIDIGLTCDEYELADDKLVVNLSSTTAYNFDTDDMIVVTNSDNSDDTYTEEFVTKNAPVMSSYYSHILNFPSGGNGNMHKINTLVKDDFYANDVYGYGTYFNKIHNVEFGFTLNKDSMRTRDLSSFIFHRNKFKHYELSTMVNGEREINTLTELPLDINNYKFIKKIGNKL